MSNSPELNTLLIYAALGSGANILVNCVGIVAAIVFWRRSPKAAIICIASLSLLLLIQIISPLLVGFMARTIAATPDQIGIANLQFNLVTNFIHAIAIGLMIWAVFIDRRQNRSL
jgi:hypothetical protein